VRLLLVYPMTFYVFYIWLLLTLSFRRRVAAIKSGELSYKYFKTYDSATPSAAVHVAGRHADNQFQAPMIFFFACCVHMIVNQVNETTVTLAWLFIFTRIVHSYIHLGRNNVRNRATAYIAGWIVLLLMWIQLLWFASHVGAF
jgi:hypothetical protein